MWEKIPSNTINDHGERAEIPSNTFRLCVPGGWLVQSLFSAGSVTGGVASSVSITFYPDPEYKWGLDPKGAHVDETV